LSFAAMWESTYRPPASRSRLMWAATAACSVALLLLAASQALGTAGNLGISMRELQAGGPAHSSLPMREQWLQEVLSAQKRPPAWDPLRRLQPVGGSALRHPRKAGGRASTATSPVDPTYALLYGSSSRFAAASLHPSMAPQKGKSGPGQARSSIGTTSRARLRDQVASQPSGAPVIALLGQRLRLGDQSFAANSEIHGIVVGSSDAGTRLFVDFKFIRRPNGSIYNIVATARDEQGRQGLPGARLIGKSSAGSVGLAAASQAMGAAGRALAGTAGSIVGAGIDGATGSALGKVNRMDQDESLILCEAGLPFNLYVLSAGEPVDP
jgi:hypothetical protein